MPLWYKLTSFVAGLLVQVVPRKKGKLGLLLDGQKRAWELLKNFKHKNPQAPFWFHCASLGEFEQAKPVLLALKVRYPAVPIVVTFFSSSGYEARKNFAQAELICYLPFDTLGAAGKWVKELQPRAVFWVKYEFWLGYLSAISAGKIPFYLLAAAPKATYFRGLKASYYQDAYSSFDKIFLQYESLAQLFPPSLKAKLVATGDPRFDNVLNGVREAAPIPELQSFKEASPKPILLVGSAWPEDLAVLLPALAALQNPYRLVVFPHEMDPAFLQAIEQQAVAPVSIWSQGIREDAETVLVDKVGFLSKAYAYADVAWVGGAFGKGLHNILEAAAWGKPVLFGPKIENFLEASYLEKVGGGLSVSTSAEAQEILAKWLKLQTRQKAGAAARTFVESHAGATGRILAQLDL